ncbi:hypothetical protein HYH02_014609 [Chlamydomonas schloesseri]|uniref:Uncharacterized protein n=1 Tax=Chlamydomonas schloesseri TaxID=2026947 RepID=A0A835SI28_9CHLO|nr:hypothetical protein HYH02_014609 [Chlamydomonas schloesseri]|eukprot:KAG2427389.1 hypothetical protein HYH02_014609 [Chlamydomonas schloesseri]
MFGSRTKPGELAGPDDNVARCDKYDWVFWVDADVFITNLTVAVTDVIEAARRMRPNQDYPHFIASRNADLDTAFSFNTGTALVRCSDLGLRLMNKMVELRVTHKDDTYIKGWEHQAALMIAYRDNEWVRDITTFVPPKLFNSYPYRLGDDNGNLRSCGDPQGAECQKGYWTPGDFLIHFPGSGKKFVNKFLQEHPPPTWPGANDDFTPGRRRRRGRALLG